MKELVLPHTKYNGCNRLTNEGNFELIFRTRANGDVEVIHHWSGDSESVETVIPKEKRAELAQFLVHS